MSQDSGDRLQMRNLPWALWAPCSLFILIGLLPAVVGGRSDWLIFAGGGLLAIALLTNVTSLTAERSRGMVTLTSWTPLRGPQRREIPSRDIARVSIDRSTGSDGPTVQTVLVFASGEQMPLTRYFAGERDGQEAAARRLSDFLAQDCASRVPVVDDATTCHEQTGLTAGIDWRLEMLVGPDGNAVTRWSTTAGGYADGLLILCQMDQGLGRLPWDAGPLAEVSKLGFRSLLFEYHFKAADIEAVDKVNPLQDLDPRLHGSYLAFATSADAARRWLGPARAEALANWAAAHPAPSVQWADAGGLGGLLLLAGPSGLWLVFRGSTQDPARIVEVADLGAALAAASAMTSKGS